MGCIKLTKQLKICAIIFFLISFVSCKKESIHEVQAYVEGRYTYLTASVPGILKQVFVERGTEVKKDQALFFLDSMPESANYQASLAEYAQANFEKNKLLRELQYIKMTLSRYQSLLKSHAIQQDALDKTQTDYDDALIELQAIQEKILSLKAKLNASKWSLQQKKVYAPMNARVFDVYYQVGEYVTTDQSVLSLLVDQDVKLIFYVSEKDLPYFHLAKKINIYREKDVIPYQAQVNFISPSAEYVPPVIFSKETNEKLVYRLEAALDEKIVRKFNPGQPVRVTYQLND